MKSTIRTKLLAAFLALGLLPVSSMLAAAIAEQRLGMSSLRSHGASHRAGFMPQGMQETGSAMHQAASRFAVTAQNAAVTRDLPRALGG